MSKGVPQDIAERIKSVAKLEDVVPGLKKAGKNLVAKCPFCGREGKGKGLFVTPGLEIWKCYSTSCDQSGKGAVSYVMAVEKLDYPGALRFLADQYNILIDDPLPTVSEQSKKKSGKKKNKSFCDLQLESSGLTREDIMVEVKHDDKTSIAPAFRSGTRSQYGDIQIGQGDDMLIYYYDLEGRQVMYRKKNEKVMRELIRVRWQNPMQHLDKDGNPIKYQSPAGSGSHLYIPEKIRKLYKQQRKIKTLFIQEGEKKAEKSCKHNIPSVGIMGINNLGSQNKFPQELQLIMQRCEVDEVVFMLDADWNDLSGNLKNGAHVDNRPRSFFFAVKNYKEYMRTLYSIGMAVEIYFGYVMRNEKALKGIDDFINGALKGNEETMVQDIQEALHHKTGAGKYVQIHKITTISDNVLADFWHLNDSNKFAEFHKSTLESLQEFYIKNIKRRFNEEGELELDQPLEPDEQYWQVEYVSTQAGKKKILSFDYTNCYNFLQNRGYWRIKMRSGEFRFIKVENRVVEIIDNYAVKDFVTEFTKELKDKKDVRNMLYRGGTQYLGFEKLSNLEYFYPKFERAEKTEQHLFFKDKIWKINDEEIKEITYSELPGYVWKDKVIDFNADVVDSLLEAIPITKENVTSFPGYQVGEVYLGLTQTGLKCEFLGFLINTCNFNWKKYRKGNDPTDRETAISVRHLLNKLTAIGYLLHDYKNDSEMKAVIGMDGVLSEVGSSQGRTGKSLVGRAIEMVIPQVVIPAKSKKITEDNFLFGEVTEKTKNIFLDDVRANIDFEFFFPLITGKLKVNPKGGQPFTLDIDDTPKLYMTTNHAINGEGDSFADRQAYMAFSDWYNDKHKPKDDFGHNFFSEWDKQQWNLFYNLMANCLMLYFRSLKEGWGGKGMGIVDPPMESIEKRRLRQQMSEDFLAWADEYFSEDTDDSLQFGGEKRLNERLKRSDVYNDLLDKNPNLRKYVTANSFSKRIKFYCKYHKYHFNPTRPNREGVELVDWAREYPGKSFIGEPDKSAGVEYITIANEDYFHEPR